MADGEPATMIRIMREQNIASKSGAASSSASQETLKNNGGTSVQSAQVSLTLIARHYT